MKKLLLIAAVLSSVTLLASCGGGGGDNTPQVAAENAVLTADADNGRTMFTALANESFTFPTGVADFGTATTTTVTITPPAANGRNPTFTVASGGDTASGTIGFGSCFFRVSNSTFSPPSPLVNGNVIEVANCGVRLNTAGQNANDVAVQKSAVLFLNNANSTGTAVDVSISPSGRITLNGRVVGTVRLTPVTGTGGF